MFRNEKPGPGRFRQFMQFDADTVGAAGVAADAEMCMMMADTMEALGIKRGDYVIRVNNRKVLDGVMEAIGLGGDEKPASSWTCCAPSTSSTSSGPRACGCCWAGPQGRERRLHQGRGAGRGADRIAELVILLIHRRHSEDLMLENAIGA